MGDTEKGSSSKWRTFAANWRTVLDTIATVAIITVSATLLWVMLTDRQQPRFAQPIQPSGVQRSRPTPPLPATPLSIEGAQIRGSKNAKWAIIEYSDFQCPYCAQFARDTLPEIETRYVKPGKVLVAFRHLPLSQIHPFAMKASEAAECAGRQGKFWEMHDRLFMEQKQLDEVSLTRRARELDLDGAEFTRCLGGQATSKVQQDVTSANLLAVTGTPTFLIGSIESDGRVKVLQRLFGALSAAEFQAVLEKLIESNSK